MWKKKVSIEKRAGVGFLRSWHGTQPLQKSVMSRRIPIQKHIWKAFWKVCTMCTVRKEQEHGESRSVRQSYQKKGGACDIANHP